MATSPASTFGLGSDRERAPNRVPGRRRAVPLAWGVVAFAATSVSEAAAPEPGATSLPHAINLRSSDGSETAFDLLSFGCYALEGREEPNDNKVTCRFTTTSISRPTPEQVQKRLRDLDAPENPAAAAAADGFPAVCQGLAPLAPVADPALAASPQRRYQEQLAKACAAHDAVLGKEAIRFRITELWAKTCEVFNYGFREYGFEKIDEWTWRAMNGASGGTATIRTIWRKKAGNDLTTWNYKQVTSSDPSCVPTPFAECAKDSMQEWTPEATIKLSACQFFK